jgi:glyoxylase-like metal-dependent hydrolase (beta-lactamase superfamily II)
LIDDQFAPLAPKIRAAVKALTSEPVRFVINTHWHFDHTGGNEAMGRGGAVIVAHRNVRERMSVSQVMKAFGRTVPAAPKIALPVITFREAIDFHLNGVEIGVFHVEAAHTDGDAIIHFKNRGVVHMGDTYFNGMYPFIDLDSGGSVDGVITAVDRVLALPEKPNVIMTGHGPLSDRAGLELYRQMLVGVREQVAAGIAAGKNLKQVIAARPTAAFDARWGGGFIKPENFAEIVYRSLARQ